MMYVLRFKKWVRRLIGSPQKVSKYTSIMRDHSTSKVYLMDTPTNGNMGDQAIAYATIQYLRKVLPGYRLVEIPNIDVNAMMTSMKKNVEPKDIIVWNGGGNIGNLYPTAELSRWTLFKTVKKRSLFIFPQSVHFDISRKSGKCFLNQSIKNYKNQNSLSLFLRERKSFEYMREYFDVKNTFLVPDIVFTLDGTLTPEKDSERSGVITLLRSDIEKSSYDISSLFEVIEDLKLEVCKSDTVFKDIFVTEDNRYELLQKKLKSIAKHKLVVTDRLHGMVFAYLTRTPAIVIENNNWKIKSTYETWLENVNFIKVIPNEISETEARQLMESLLNIVPKPVNLKGEFEPLEKKLRSINYE